MIRDDCILFFLLGEFVCRVSLSLLSWRCQNGNYEMMGEQMIGHNACAAIARHFEGCQQSSWHHWNRAWAT